MSQPLLNDFGAPITRSQVRKVLKAAGWRQTELCGSHWLEIGTERGAMTLRQAWETHKRGGDNQ